VATLHRLPELQDRNDALLPKSSIYKQGFNRLFKTSGLHPYPAIVFKVGRYGVVSINRLPKLLQQTATHGNTLHHAAIRYNALKYSATHSQWGVHD